MKNIVVARPRPADPAIVARPAVGVIRPTGALPELCVVVKVTFSYKGTDGAARLATEQQALSLGRPSPFALASEQELFYPCDFVPLKSRTDILLVGHAYAPSATKRIAAGFAAAGVSRRFWVVASKPQNRIPLVHACLRAEGGEHQIDPVGPVAPHGSAAPLQRGAPVRADEVIELIRLSPNAEHRILRLPGILPCVFAQVGEKIEPIVLAGDTLWLDVDREIVVVSWRGSLPGTDPARFEQLLVSLEHGTSPRGADELLRALPGGSFEFAIYEDQLRSGSAEQGGNSYDLMSAKYAAWGVDAPAPSIPLETYAAISAEVAEGRTPRGNVLERHSFDEEQWTLEERAWLEQMGTQAMEGDGSIAVHYGELFMAAQDALARPEETKWTLEEYADLVVAMEEPGDPMDVLHRVAMTLSEWMRLDRRWQTRAESDPAIAEKLEQRILLARARASSKDEEEA